jgi:hypothetical protein
LSHLECEDGLLSTNLTNQPTNQLNDRMTNSTQQIPRQANSRAAAQQIQ